MTKSDAINHFGSAAALAEALGIKPAAVSQWRDDHVPIRRQYELERLTGGKLRAAEPDRSAA